MSQATLRHVITVCIFIYLSAFTEEYYARNSPSPPSQKHNNLEVGEQLVKR